MDNDPLIFELAIAKNKPHSYRAAATADKKCPFCDAATLTDIYEQQGEMIWLHNKFPTLHDTLQTVLIETSDHQGDLSSYSPEYNRKLLRFALACFEKLNNSGKFRSVAWYKNFGPNSGGSLAHPHMQIVGFKNVNAYKYLHANNFTGKSVFEDAAVEVNIAQHPVQGYVELNINLLASAGINLWADWIRSGARYMLNVISNGRCDSYNLFFYPRNNGGICAKYIARFAAPPYFVGYKLSQVNDEASIAKEARRFRKFFAEGSKLN